MFDNLKISRVTLHHIFRRTLNGERIDPNIGDQVFKPEGDVHRVLRERLVSVLANKTKSLKVEISKDHAASTFQACRTAVDSDDPMFITTSGDIANRLADAQQTQVPNEGFLFVICGTVGSTSNRYIALMKAEPQKGFSINSHKKISFALLDNLVLTPASKLYKVGIFIEKDPSLSNEQDASGWIAHLYDDNMSQSNRQNASIYYYEGFLGCSLPKDNAYKTKKLYELTDAFINDLKVSPEDRNDLKTALYTYLKVDTSTNVSVEEFANNYFGEDLQRVHQYKSYMNDQGFSDQAFRKDTTDLTGILKKRTIRFPSGVRITGSLSAINAIDIQTRAVSHDASGVEPITDHTVITVPERISVV